MENKYVTLNENRKVLGWHETLDAAKSAAANNPKVEYIRRAVPYDRSDLHDRDLLAQGILIRILKGVAVDFGNTSAFIA